MNKLASPDFSPDGCSSCPPGHSSRDHPPFLPWPPLPLPLVGVFGLLSAVLHRMAVCATPVTVTVKLLDFRFLVLPFSALLASLGLGKGFNIHGCRA